MPANADQPVVAGKSQMYVGALSREIRFGPCTALLICRPSETDASIFLLLKIPGLIRKGDRHEADQRSAAKGAVHAQLANHGRGRDHETPIPRPDRIAAGAKSRSTPSYLLKFLREVWKRVDLLG